MPRIKCAAFSIELVTLSNAKGPVTSRSAVMPATLSPWTSSGAGSPFAVPLTS